MPMNRFSTEYMLGVIENLKRPPSFLLSTFFPTVVTFQTEAVDVDVVTRARRLAPLVSPLVAGKIVNQASQETRVIKPAYTKDKRVFRPGEALKRVAGETIGGSYSPDQRRQIQLAAELEDQIGMITRRKEIMAMEALRTGKVTLVGDQYPTTVVDFQRDATLTIDISAGTPWTNAAAKPLADLRTWALRAKKIEGVFPRRVVMATDVFDIFVTHANVEKRWQAQNANLINVAIKTGDALEETATLMGYIEGFEIWVYSDWYINDAGAEVDALPAGELVMASSQLQGQQLHGAIQDAKAGLQGLEYFPKMWEEEDPSVEFLLTQSAPLVAPLRPNASVGVKVK